MANNANIQWKSWIETYNDPELNIDLLKGGILVPGDTYSFYSLNDSEGLENRKFQKIIGVFSRFTGEKEGEAIFVDCVDENNRPVGERIGFMRFKPEKNKPIFSSTVKRVNENENEKEKRLELTTTKYNNILRPRFDSLRPYGGTKKRRRGRKRRTVRRRGKSKRRRH